MTAFHCFIACSLDGRIARPDGGLDWLVTGAGPPEEFGYAAFYASVDAIVMGRGTYEACRAMGDWPYPGKPTIVLTRRALADAPEGVEARAAAVAEVVADCEARGLARVWVEGGGDVVRQFMAIGRLDVLEVAMLPVVLGAGIPLFREGCAESRFTLRAGVARGGGVLHLIYDRA
jgi:dihydrofolate reductase